MSTFQQCPVCNGSGQVLAPGFTSAMYTMCPVCNGMRIISQLTGLPPGGIPAAAAEPKQKYNLSDQRLCTEYARFTITERLRDPQCTLDDIWAKWVIENNL